ncbi:SDR family oxidoreductase [Occultella glacieicola]|uniref:SDR family oxidoreductase n=1 Tax=Occultella glacieicola TaxID=2518684 RepID=UPI001A9EA887|nr:SDR family oxidoreductase [Occultella glacieicola]
MTGPESTPSATDRVALVTGGNRGIGFEIARQLGAAGLRVALGCRRPADAADRVTALRDAGTEATAVELDVIAPGSPGRAVATVMEVYGRLDVLVNNAGIAIDAWPSHRPSEPDLDRVRTTIETNLFGAWACVGAAVPAMRANRYGRIVNLSSTMASIELTDDPRSPAYRVSKSALNMLTVVVAEDLRADGILVNAASPGYTRSDMSPKATRPVEDGADTPVWLATLPNDGPTGGFFYEREPLPW